MANTGGLSSVGVSVSAKNYKINTNNNLQKLEGVTLNYQTNEYKVNEYNSDNYNDVVGVSPTLDELRQEQTNTQANTSNKATQNPYTYEKTWWEELEYTAARKVSEFANKVDNFLENSGPGVDYACTIVQSFSTGVISVFEDIGDGIIQFGGSAVANIAEALGEDEFAADVKDITEDAIDDDWSNDLYAENMKTLKVDDEIAYSTAHDVSTMAGSITGYVTLAAVTGDIKAAVSKVVMPLVGMFSSMGSSAEIAYQSGATFEEAEIVSTVSGLVGFITGGILDKLGLKGAQNATIKEVVKYGLQSGFVSMLEPVINSVTEYNVYAKDKIDEAGDKLYDGFMDYYTKSGGIINTAFAGITSFGGTTSKAVGNKINISSKFKSFLGDAKDLFKSNRGGMDLDAIRSKKVDIKTFKATPDEAALGDFFGISKKQLVPSYQTNNKFDFSNLTPEQINLVDFINYQIRNNGRSIVAVNDTRSLSSHMLSKIDDLSNVEIQIIDGLGDGKGGLKQKYQGQSKYIERITYTGFEVNEIIKNIENIQSKIDISLPPFERAKQVYEVLAAEVPPMWDFESQDTKISQSLRGLTDYNSVGKKGLICAGYASAYQEICKRVGLDCEYIRGRTLSDPLRRDLKGGGHAWNVVKIDDYIVPVDVTWHNTNNKGTSDWFGPSQLFEDTRIADPDEVFNIYNIEIPKVATSIDDVVATIDSKSGFGVGIQKLREYVDTGDISKITRTNDSRNYIYQLDINDVKQYIYEYDFNETMKNVVLTIDNKEGAGIGMVRLRNYVQTGNIAEITRTNNARVAVDQYTIDEVFHWLKENG